MANASITQYLVRHQLLARTAGMVLITVILLFAAILPLSSAISQNTRKIATRDKERAALVDKVTLLSQLDSQVLADRLQILDRALPPNKDVVAYLAALDGLSRELGLSFGGLSLAPGEVSETTDKAPTKKAATGLQTLDTVIKVRGGETAIYSFLRSVEQTLPLMQIKDVKVSASSPGQYALSLTLAMMWAPPGNADVKGAVSLFNEKEEAYFQTLAGYRSYKAELTDLATTRVEDNKLDLFSR